VRGVSRAAGGKGEEHRLHPVAVARRIAAKAKKPGGKRGLRNLKLLLGIQEKTGKCGGVRAAACPGPVHVDKGRPKAAGKRLHRSHHKRGGGRKSYRGGGREKEWGNKTCIASWEGKKNESLGPIGNKATPWGGGSAATKNFDSIRGPNSEAGGGESARAH